MTSPASYLLVFLSLFRQPEPQGPAIDYRLAFGDNWVKAEALLKENEIWMRPALAGMDIPFDEAVAIIFPELVRYSALRDKMETGVLKALYVNLGEEYADFSIGIFQVKPSFAEKVCADLKKLPRKKRVDISGCAINDKTTREFRKAIVSDLESPQKELNFLIAFYMICSERFGDLQPGSDERIEFFSTAYNTGYWKEPAVISSVSQMKNFHLRPVSRDFYSYSDISLFWFHNYRNTIIK